jgi:hypothetical protein
MGMRKQTKTKVQLQTRSEVKVIFAISVVACVVAMTSFAMAFLPNLFSKLGFEISDSCVVPYSGMQITKDTILCSGEYDLEVNKVNGAAIYITNSNTYLTCQPDTIINYKSSKSGFAVIAANSATSVSPKLTNVGVSNCQFNRFTSGIYFADTINSKIENNTITNMNANSITGKNNENISIAGNIIGGTTANGITFTSSSGVIARNDIGCSQTLAGRILQSRYNAIKSDGSFELNNNYCDDKADSNGECDKSCSDLGISDCYGYEDDSTSYDMECCDGLELKADLLNDEIVTDKYTCCQPDQCVQGGACLDDGLDNRDGDMYCGNGEWRDINFVNDLNDIALTREDVYPRFVESFTESDFDIGSGNSFEAGLQYGTQMGFFDEGVAPIQFERYGSVIDAKTMFNIANTRHTREVIFHDKSIGDEIFCHESVDFYDLSGKYYFICGFRYQNVYVQAQSTLNERNYNISLEYLRKIYDKIRNYNNISCLGYGEASPNSSVNCCAGLEFRAFNFGNASDGICCNPNECAREGNCVDSSFARLDWRIACRDGEWVDVDVDCVGGDEYDYGYGVVLSSGNNLPTVFEPYGRCCDSSLEPAFDYFGRENDFVKFGCCPNDGCLYDGECVEEGYNNPEWRIECRDNKWIDMDVHLLDLGESRYVSDVEDIYCNGELQPGYALSNLDDSNPESLYGCCYLDECFIGSGDGCFAYFGASYGVYEGYICSDGEWYAPIQ